MANKKKPQQNNTENKKPAKNAGVGAANSSAKESKNQNAQRKASKKGKRRRQRQEETTEKEEISPPPTPPVQEELKAPKKKSKGSKSSKKPGICSVLCKYFLLTLLLLSGLGTMLYFVNNDVQEVVDIYIQHAKDADLGNLKGIFENFPSILSDESQESVEEKKESYPMENDFVDDDEGELRGNLPPPVTETKPVAEEKPVEAAAVVTDAKESETKASEHVEKPVIEEPVTPVIEETVVPVAEELKVKESHLPVAEEPEIQEHDAPVVEEPKTLVAEEQDTPMVGEPEELKPQEPEVPVAKETVADEPEAQEPEAPVAEEPSAQEPETPVAEEPRAQEPETPREPRVQEAEAPKVDESQTQESEADELWTQEPEAPEPDKPQSQEAEAPEPDKPQPQEAEAPEPDEPQAQEAEAPEPDEPQPQEAEAPEPDEPQPQEAEAPEPDEPQPQEAEAPEPDEPQPQEAEAPEPDEPQPQEAEAPEPDEPQAQEAEAPEPDEPQAQEAEAPEPGEPQAQEAEAPEPGEPQAQEAEAPEPDEPQAQETKASEPDELQAQEAEADEPWPQETEAPEADEQLAQEAEVPEGDEPQAQEAKAPKADELRAQEPEAPMAQEHDAPVADESEAYVADELKAQDPQAPDVDEPRTREPEAPKDDESSSQESKSPQSNEELKDNEFEDFPTDDIEKHEIPLTEGQRGEEPEDFVEEQSLHPTEPESHVPEEENSKETKTQAPEIAKPKESESENQMPEETATPTVPEPTETVHEAVHADSTSTNEDKIYEKMSITNSVDYLIRDELDAADELLKDSPREALETFNNLLSKNLKSPRATYGRAAALSDIAKLESSNQILEQSMQVLEVLLSNPDTPDALLLKGGLDLAKKQHFRGWTKRAVKTLTFLNLRFPHDTVVQNELGVTYLLLGRNEDAKTIFQDVLKNHPRNGFAMVHLGFIIKTHDNNPAKAIPYLRDGIATGENGVLDARFYFHLGDAYQRVGQNKQAKRVYEDGAARKLFLSRDQRSLYNVDRLTAKPWWDPEELPYKKSLETLENNWETIRDEVLSLISSSNDAFVDEIEKLREKGVWKQLTLYQRGIKARNGCEYTPRTCAILQRLPDTINCKRGQVKFSLMQPGTHVWPHCGPTNCRIRAHLGLVVPSGARIKVGNHTREWKEGKFIIFDDSFEHEVWHQGNTSRVVLIVDLWHPELTAAEKATLPPI